MGLKKEEFDQFMEHIKRLRDELEVKIHLAGKDIKEDWEELEVKLEKAREEALDAGGDIGEAAERLAGELKKGYQRIAKSFRGNG